MKMKGTVGDAAPTAPTLARPLFYSAYKFINFKKT